MGVDHGNVRVVGCASELPGFLGAAEGLRAQPRQLGIVRSDAYIAASRSRCARAIR